MDHVKLVITSCDFASSVVKQKNNSNPKATKVHEVKTES